MSSYGAVEAHSPSISPATEKGERHATRNAIALRTLFTLVVGLAGYQAYTKFSDERSDTRLYTVPTAAEDHATEKTSHIIGVSSETPIQSKKTYITPSDYSGNSTPLSAHFESVECGFGVMKLACRVKIKTTKVYQDSHSMFVEYAPSSSSEKLTAVRSENFKPSANNMSATIEIYRVRALTNYTINLFVMEKGFLKHTHTADFRTVGTGFEQFDVGPLVEVEGTPMAPLLNYAIHLDGFRGVVVNDVEGYVVWYLNSSATDASAHLEAVEKSDKGHVWCVNDQGDSTVNIVDAMGNVLASKTWREEETSSTSLQGHECRFSTSSDKMRVVLLTDQEVPLTDKVEMGLLNISNREVESYRITGYYEEYIQVYEPAANGVDLVENITLNDYFPFESYYTFNVYSLNYLSSSTYNLSHSFMDLYSEFTPADGNVSDLRYIHPSSVSVAEDGDLYIVTFRDCHMVVGINRTTLDKKFMLSSVVPGLGTHDFQNDHHKFYAPHDVSYHDNNTVCLMDDGSKRPQGDCTDDDNIGCFSRAVCYYLDDDTSTVQLIWEFEYPHEMAGAPLNASMMNKDLFNINGGSIRRVSRTDWVVSFTATDANFAPLNHSSWSFGLRENSDHDMRITSIQKLPRCVEWAENDGSSGSYRATPIRSINGELSVQSSLVS